MQLLGVQAGRSQWMELVHWVTCEDGAIREVLVSRGVLDVGDARTRRMVEAAKTMLGHIV